MTPIRVAIVDDSSFVRQALVRILRDHPRVRIVGVASSGEELLANLEVWRPDVITLDLAMPGMGGLRTLDRIMAARPTPVIILSTHSEAGAPQTIEALHRGAVDFLDKQQFSLVDFVVFRNVLMDKILSVAGDRAEGRESTGPPRAAPRATGAEKGVALQEAAAAARAAPAFRAVFIGASTGGPPAIQRLLGAFETPPAAPVLIVQHMPAGFTRAFAQRLNAHLAFPVGEAIDGEALVGGRAFVAPAGLHLRVREDPAGRLVASLDRRPEDVAHRPSIDVLLDSACELSPRAVVAVLLTGMGRDGARGLAGLRRLGAHTLVQDEGSSVVYGMPRAAIELDAAREVLPLEEIGPRLRRLLERRRDLAAPAANPS